ncbi:MAG: family 10 glycosylhydrolase [Kiritimatiellae bacterium]|nr:family 10 glycosylhydrolase [Kiritimatiellia bacterium]
MIKSLLLAVTIVANSSGYYTSLANHIKRWLASEKITSTVVLPAQMAATIENEKTVFLVGLDSIGADQIKALRGVKSRGGKIIAFHSSSTQLASLMGVKLTGFKSAPSPGCWSRMDFITSRPQGFPISIRQTSTVLNSAQPLSGGRVLASWSDRLGRPTGQAAWIETPSGWWMTHVLTADGDERLKAQLVSAMVGVSEPSKWSISASLDRRNLKRAEFKRYALSQKPKAGEIRAVWDHSGCGLYPGDWPRTMRFLKNAGITDLFVNVAGAGFAHYPSAVLPKSRIYNEEGDQLKACLSAAKGTGVRVHAWILCFTATRGMPSVLADYKAKGWSLKSTSGKDTEYLNPSKKPVRDKILKAIEEVVSRYSIDGVHLDFVRWYEGSKKPSDAAKIISDFVLAARRKVQRPLWLTTAVLGKYPACVASVGQDWTSWLDANYVDYVVPMDYTDNLVRFSSYLLQHASSRSRARRTIVGIGVTANESRLDAKQVIDQINASRKFGTAGVALFDLDAVLEKEILPYLSIGIWK